MSTILAEPPSNYREVLQSITCLQADLESKKRINCTLKEENTHLQESYKQSIESLTAAQKRHAAIQETLKNTATATTKRERTLEESLASCRSQIDKYREEIETLRKQVNGALKDDVALRAQLQVQIEATAQTAIEKLEVEVI